MLSYKKHYELKCNTFSIGKTNGNFKARYKGIIFEIHFKKTSDSSNYA